MNNLTRADRVAGWLKAQGDHHVDEWMTSSVELGPILSDAWARDPKRVLFTLARYKIISKMLVGEAAVAEVGAGDGWASELVDREVKLLDLYDLSPLRAGIHPYDIREGALPKKYDSIYSLDVLEHIANGDLVFKNLKNSLNDRGRLIVGMPSKESQVYASEPSRRLHINCLSGEELRKLAERHFHHVFMFGMNDETLHCGFLPMAHYLIALCAEPIR